MSSVLNENLTRFEQGMINLFLNAAGVVGVPKSIAMIYGVLFGSVNALTFNEIKQKLNISKGSVSQGLRVLREVGAIEISSPLKITPLIEQTSDSMKSKHYKPVLDLRYIVKNLLSEKLHPQVESSSLEMAKLEEIIQSEVDSEILFTRLDHLRSWRQKFLDVIPLIKLIVR